MLESILLFPKPSSGGQLWVGSDQSAIKISVSNAFRSRLPLIFVNALILILNSQQVEPCLAIVRDMERGGGTGLRHHTSSRYLQLNKPLKERDNMEFRELRTKQ